MGQGQAHIKEESLKSVDRQHSAEPDYMLRVIPTDLPAFQHRYDSELATLRGVQKLTSTLVVKNIVKNRRLALQLAYSDLADLKIVTGESQVRV